MNYKTQAGAGVWVATFASFAAFVFLTGERSVAVEADVDLKTRKAPFHEVERIIQNRCTTCHARYPSSAAFKSPPAGVILETPADIAAYAPKILYRTWVTRTMPLANQTGITEDERATVAAWVEQGAKVEAAPRWETTPASAAELAEARTFYAARCASCHGPEGRGDGPVAAGLALKPASLRDHGWHFRTPDEALAKVIIEGGAAVGKHATMPPSLDLQDKKGLANALVQLVRSFEDKPPEGSPPPPMPSPAGEGGDGGTAR
jgi:uncharacterized membrane protein